MQCISVCTLSICIYSACIFRLRHKTQRKPNYVFKNLYQIFLLYSEKIKHPLFQRRRWVNYITFFKTWKIDIESKPNKTICWFFVAVFFDFLLLYWKNRNNKEKSASKSSEKKIVKNYVLTILGNKKGTGLLREGK